MKCVHVCTINIFHEVYSDFVLNYRHHRGSTHAFHATIGQIGPKVGCLGLYIKSKQRSKIELIYDNLLVIFVNNM